MSELNGVGMMPSQELVKRLAEGERWCPVECVNTTARLKEDAFGWIKMLLQSGRLAVPEHPPLLRQLASLEYAQTEAGMMRISVPESRGHDDLAMGLALAASTLMRDDTWGPGGLAPLPDSGWDAHRPRPSREVDFMSVLW